MQYIFMINPVATTLANFDFPTLLCIKETHSSRLKGVLCLLGYFYLHNVSTLGWNQIWRNIFIFCLWIFMRYFLNKSGLLNLRKISTLKKMYWMTILSTIHLFRIVIWQFFVKKKLSEIKPPLLKKILV